MLVTSIAVFRALSAHFCSLSEKTAHVENGLQLCIGARSFSPYFTVSGAKSGAPVSSPLVAFRARSNGALFFFFYRKNYTAFRMIPSCTDSAPFSCFHNAALRWCSVQPCTEIGNIPSCFTVGACVARCARENVTWLLRHILFANTEPPYKPAAVQLRLPL